MSRKTGLASLCSAEAPLTCFASHTLNVKCNADSEMCADRLVLAGLRVASKALDDLGHSHTRFAKVGGVTERELGRLEVSFCFVTDFELKVDEEMLLSHAKFIRDGKDLLALPISFQPKLPPVKGKEILVAG